MAISASQVGSFASILSSLGSIATTTFVRTVAASRLRLFAAGVLAAGVAITTTADQALLDAQWEEQQKKINEAIKRDGSGGVPLFHYTDVVGQTEILASQSIKSTSTFMDETGFAHPPGAYATDILPVGPYTQKQLQDLFKGGNRSWDVSRFVMMSSSIDPFYPTGYPREWVRPARANTFVPVRILLSGVNLMPPD